MTLEKLSRALEMPLYRVLYDGDESPSPIPIADSNGNEKLWGNDRKEVRMLSQFRQVFSQMKDADRDLLLTLAKRMAANRKRQ